MNIFKKFNNNKTPDRYPENSQGDFYVENQVCISCGALEDVAPDLIEHSKLEYGHCYFKKQPQTQDEIDRAIDAMAVSCISGLRYGGRDEKILKRLYEIGEAEQCDYKPIGSYKMLVWTKVTFFYTGTIKQLSDSLTSQIVLDIPHLKNEILDYKTNDHNYFEFTYRWTDGLTGIIYKCNYTSDGQCKIELTKEKDGYLNAIRGNAISLNIILCKDKNASEIIWFDIDDNTYDKTEIR